MSNTTQDHPYWLISQDQKFRAWIKQIDEILQDKVGITSNDLGDISYRIYFDEGLEPNEIVGILGDEEGFADLL